MNKEAAEGPEIPTPLLGGLVNNMEQLHQLCNKHHDDLSRLLTAQDTQIQELRNYVVELQEHRRANQQPLQDVTNTLVELTRKISHIWHLSKGAVVTSPKSETIQTIENVPSLETVGIPALNGSFTPNGLSASYPALIPGLKTSTTTAIQDGTMAVASKPDTSTTGHFQGGASAVLVKPSTSTTASSHISAAFAVTKQCTPALITMHTSTTAVASQPQAASITVPAASLQLSTTVKHQTDSDGAPPGLTFATMPSSIKWARISEPGFEFPPPIKNQKPDHSALSTPLVSKDTAQAGDKRKRDGDDESNSQERIRKVAKEVWQIRDRKESHDDSDS